MVKRYAVLLFVVIGSIAMGQQAQFFGLQNKENTEQITSPIEKALNDQLSKHPISGSFNLFKLKPGYQLPNHIKAPKDASKNDIIYLELNPDMHKKLLKENHRTLSLTIPFNEDSVIHLDLYKKNPFSDDLIIRTDKGEVYKPSNQLHYRGTVRGHRGSVAGLSIVNNQIMGVYATREHGHVNIAKIDELDGLHAMYPEDVFPEEEYEGCQDGFEVPERFRMDQIDEQVKSSSNHENKCVKVYIETNFNLFNNKGSVAGVENYVNGIFNNVAILYQNEEINSEISEIFVWTSPDPYSGNVGNALGQFRANRQGFNGDIAHLFILNGSGGGVAYVNVLCVPSWAFAVSNINSSYNNFPNYSWTIMVVAHEMGHNLGSRHTQWCGWPGGAIDNCYQTEGSCPPGPSPTGGGTIMSYCHLTGWGINFLNGFGPLPGNRIRDRVGSVGCLDTGCNSLNCSDFEALVNITNTTCGEDNGVLEISVSGGSEPYLCNIGDGFTSDLIFTNLPAGNYNITLIDNNNCELLLNAFIEDSSMPILSIVETPTTCNLPNGSVEATAINGTAPFSFDFGQGVNNSGVFTDLESGFYFMTLTDALGCTDELGFFIDESDPIVANVNAQPTTCGLDNGSVEFYLSGGSGNDQFFIDIEGGSNFSTETSYEDLPSGFYTAYILDDTGCELYVDFLIDDSDPAVLSTDVTPASCGLSNGIIEVDITGINDWFQIDGQFSSDSIFDGLNEGDYEIIGQNLEGCSDTLTVFIPSSDELFAEINISHAYCGELGSATVDVIGEGDFTFNIGNGPQSSPTFDGLESGDYTITFTNEDNCIGNIDFAIEGTDAINLNINTTHTSCGFNNGAFSIQPSGGSGAPYFFSYDNLDDGPDTYSDLSPGQYVLTVEDTSGCNITTTITIQSSEAVIASLDTQPTTCGQVNGALSVETTSGVSPFSYDIGSGSQSSGDFNNLSFGEYDLTVTDAEGCASMYSFIIEESSEISVQSQIVNESCMGANGQISITIAGGSGDYTIQFNGENSNNVAWDNLSQGSYALYIEDQTSCTYSDTFNIVNSGTPPNSDFNIIRNGLEITAINNSTGLNISYIWDFGDGNSSTQSNPQHLYAAEGEYEVCLIVENDCGQDQSCRSLNVAEISACIERDSLALIALYNATNGPNWNINWDLDTPINTWYGLNFNSNGCLIRIDLPSNNLQGYLPDEIGNFEQLIGLDLNDNLIGETIPASIGELSSLIFLNLSKNLFDNQLPESFTDLVSLRNLEINSNLLQGGIPNDVDKLKDLRYLDFSNNQFSGNIPESLFDLSYVEYIDLSHNDLTGMVAEDIIDLNALKRLYLNHNHFEGAFPESIKMLVQLEALWIQNNNFISFPDVSNMNNWSDGPGSGLRIQNNNLTFKDIVYNMDVLSSLEYGRYAPQSKVFKDTTIIVSHGEPFEIDINVDKEVDGVIYSWFVANDMKYSFSDPIFDIDEVTENDEGVYIGELTHPDAPDLTLETFPVTIVVDMSTSASIIETEIQEVKLYPNPVQAQSEIIIALKNVDLRTNGKVLYSILSSEGKVLSYNQSFRDFSIIGEDIQFVTKAPAIPGVYFIRITDGKNLTNISKLIVY